MGYLTNFIVYTLAMVGVIVVALLVFKNATSVSSGHGSKHLKIIDTLNIGQRKTLYIVSAGKEKFLIAGDVDRTSLISKLDMKENNISSVAVATAEEDFQTNNSQETALNRKQSYADRSIIGITSSMLNQRQSQYNSVIKNIAEKMRGE